MAEAAVFVYASAGLLSPRLLAEAQREAPRARAFEPRGYVTLDSRPLAPAEHAANLETAFELLCERFDAVRARLDQLPTPELRDRWLLPLLSLLDFEPVFQRSHLRAHPDDERTFGITHRGWDGPEATPMLLAAGALGTAAGRRRSPHEELQEFLNLAPGHAWGLASNGAELRLLREFHHSRLKAYAGFDLRGIFEARDFAGFRALYRLCHVSRFRRRADGPAPLEELFEESRREGIQVGRDLQPQIKAAIESLGTGLLTPELRDRLREGTAARAFYRELLLVVYRMLFMLFAEQRRMLPAAGPYAESYSMTRLREVAEQGLADPRHEDLWEGLKASFRLLARGSPRAGVFPYDGRLFDPGQTPTVSAGGCANRHVLRAVRELTVVELGGLRQYVDYAHLGVEELGAVYESLLPYALRAGPQGQVYLDPVSTERRDLGAHYTRPELVDFVLQVSLDRLIAERLERAGPGRAEHERALLEIRVLDPACGSGAFLVGAIDRLAGALAGVRAGAEKPTEDRVQAARREVLQHCIHGVDKDLFAVELCKVSLWIHCAVRDLPLTFLDHRIQHGDSLVGWDLLSVPAAIPSMAFATTGRVGEGATRRFLASARERNQAVLDGQAELGEELPEPALEVDFPHLAAEEERLPADIDRKTRAYEAYLASDAHLRWRRAADLWTAAFFWGPSSGEPPTTADYWRALRGDAELGLAAEADRICREFPAFHWPLRFPEVRRRGGFDCVLGNPPWEQFESREDEWFAVRAPEIAVLRGAGRKEAIGRLPEENRQLHEAWRLYSEANERLAEYSRNCGRFTEPGGKANTYLLFTELAARLLRPDGRAGVLVKTALATDKGGQPVFQPLLARGRVEELHDVVNGGPTGTDLTFTAVDAKERFCVLALRGPGGRSDFEATLLNWNVAEAVQRPRERFTHEILRALNPRTRSLTSFRRPEELRVALDLHRAHPTLDFEEGGGNPWRLSYHTLFNSTTDSHLFLRREELELEGWELGPDMVFRRPGGGDRPAGQIGLLPPDASGSDEALPIYEGQLANRYDHRAKTYEGYHGANKYGRAPGIPETTDERKADPGFEVEPRYWMLTGHARRRLAATVGERALIGFRDVGAVWRNQRSAKGAILPRVAATHTLPVVAVPVALAIEFIALFNSTVFDFLVRGHMPGAHVALAWMLAQIPAPAPGLDPRLTEAARRLSLTSWSVARLFGAEPHRWDPDERRRLDVEVDALVAHAYRLTREQYEVVLDSFEVMAREQVRRFGTFRFKEECLAAYSSLG